MDKYKVEFDEYELKRLIICLEYVTDCLTNRKRDRNAKALVETDLVRLRKIQNETIELAEKQQTSLINLIDFYNDQI